MDWILRCCGKNSYETLRDEDDDVRATKISSPAGAASAGQRASMPELVVDNTWKKDLENIIKRPSQQLPIHIDLGRLVSKIVIYNLPNEPVFQYQAPDEDDANNLQNNIIRFLQTMALALVDKEASKVLEHAALNNPPIKDDSEIVDVITKVLEQINSTSEVPDSSPLIRVLKCVNQKVMFPPFHCLKQLLKLDRLKDVAGSWRIAIQFGRDVIRVVHSKLQDIPDPEDISTFLGRFQWHLVFELSSATQELVAIELVVDEVTMYETDQLELSQRLQHCLQALGPKHRS
jgi:hypothetical protein